MTFNNIDQNTQDILYKHLEITPETKVMLVYDTETELTKALFESYKKHLTNPVLIEFPKVEEDYIVEEVNKLEKGSLVVLIQTGSFRMSKFRWRLELFHRGLKVVEHARLGHNKKEEYQTYIDSLTCDIEENTKNAEYVTKTLEQASVLTCKCKDGSELIINAPFEDFKPNLGTFDNQVNKGGAFPVGEVFTEPKDLSAFNGTLSIRAYPSMDHKVIVCKPFQVNVQEGFLSYGSDAPEEFQELMKLIEEENDHGKIPMREIGFGLNKHISFEKKLSETSAFERQRGLHFSLGMKHNIYRKKVPKEINQRYHIDIYIDIDEMKADDTVFFKENKYLC